MIARNMFVFGFDRNSLMTLGLKTNNPRVTHRKLLTVHLSSVTGPLDESQNNELPIYNKLLTLVFLHVTRH